MRLEVHASTTQVHNFPLLSLLNSHTPLSSVFEVNWHAALMRNLISGTCFLWNAAEICMSYENSLLSSAWMCPHHAALSTKNVSLVRAHLKRNNLCLRWLLFNSWFSFLKFLFYFFVASSMTSLKNIPSNKKSFPSWSELYSAKLTPKAPLKRFIIYLRFALELSTSAVRVGRSLPRNDLSSPS